MSAQTSGSDLVKGQPWSQQLPIFPAFLLWETNDDPLSDVQGHFTGGT